ncbi:MULTISPECIES: hypothetical protein [unclassified Coleofasciculus]|uniref:hypothetical protein n=1 Tax=Cyanophyceae TaxID=3028117 RepID=UPI0016823CDD|nr:MULTISPECIES: hypothetical protein [unclassified Coleofasciculus]MBD1878679.1 hypothetical protein [Coleofasciculus sp. FACHB-T130]MBD2542268.1 hypothetical protein [Coleofasciculus sp. FACHB-SPT36]
MPKIELTIRQVIDLVKQLPQEDQSILLDTLASERKMNGTDRLTEKEQQMRVLSAERGLDWDSLSEDDQEVLVDKLLHKHK